MADTDNRDDLHPLAIDDLFKDLDAILAQEPAAAGGAESSPGISPLAGVDEAPAADGSPALLDDPLWQELTMVPPESAAAIAEAGRLQLPTEQEPEPSPDGLPSLAELIASSGPVAAVAADREAAPTADLPEAALPADRVLGPDDLVVDIGDDREPAAAESGQPPEMPPVELPEPPLPAVRELGPDDLIVDVGDNSAPVESAPAPPPAELVLPELPAVPAPPAVEPTIEELLADFDRPATAAAPEPIPPPPLIMPAAELVADPAPPPALPREAPLLPDLPPLPPLPFVLPKTRTEKMTVRTAPPPGPLDENDPAAWLNCGNDWRAKGALGRAAECYERVLALNPQSVKGCCNLAGVLFELGEREEAEKFLRAGLKLEPGNKVLKENLAGLRRAERRQRRW